MVEVFRILFMGNTRTRVKIMQAVWCVVVHRGKGFIKRGRIRQGNVWGKQRRCTCREAYQSRNHEPNSFFIRTLLSSYYITKY